MLDLRPEDAAQGARARPNPYVAASLPLIGARHGELESLTVVDQGVGRLRHIEILSSSFGCVYAVDTKLQLNRCQRLFGVRGRIREIHRLRDGQLAHVRPLSAAAFQRTRLGADAVFSVCVYQAVPEATRIQVALAALRNLRPGGTYVVIASRNDASVLRRCTSANRAEDGHVFTRNGALTFFRNFRSATPLVDLLVECGFQLVHNHSRYRHVWLVLQRPVSEAEQT